MTNNSVTIKKNGTGLLEISSWIFGFVTLFIGLVNCFWGNDALFGVFIVLLSFVFFPPVMALITTRLKIRIPGLWKVVLAVFILWAAMGVGELPAKIEMMTNSFR